MFGSIRKTIASPREASAPVPPIPLGVIARDTITGIKGRVSSTTLESNGNWRVGIQPPSENASTLPESIGCDAPMVEIVDQDPLPGIAPLQPMEFPHMAVVRDVASGLEGVVQSQTWHVGGCQYYGLIGTTPDKRGERVSLYIAGDLLRLVRDNVERTPSSSTRQPTGGPTVRNQYRR